MIHELKAYPEYKPTRVDWLDALPRHWTELSLKRIAVLDNSGSYGDDPDGGGLVLPVATTAQIDRDGNFNVSKMPRRGFSERQVSRFACRPGDILVVKSSGNAANVISGKVGFVRPETPRFVFSNFLMRLVARRAYVQPELLFHLLTCNLTRERVKRMVSTTTYPNLRVDEYCYAILPLPPTSEQSAIVEYLGHANRKIEQFIRTKRRLIALLIEQKQSIIHRAVTRGLSTDTRLRSSGISWLGDIPAHWEVKRIKYLLREVDARSKTGAETLLSMRMYHGLVVFADHFSRPPQAATLVGFKIVKPGQFVVNRMQAGNGVIFPSHLTGLVSPDYAVFEPIANVNVDYLGELFRSRSVRVKFRSESKGLGTGSSGFLRLYNDRFGAIHVALPPRDEQDAILRGLGDKLSDLNAAIARTECEIALVQEYRTRLTAEVVTGKVDVREAASHLSGAHSSDDFEADAVRNELDLAADDDEVIDE